MKLTLDRADLYRFERLVCKLTKPSNILAVSFVPQNGGLKLIAACSEAVITLPIAADGNFTTFSLAYDVFKQLVSKKSERMTIDVQGDCVNVSFGDERRWFTTVKRTDTLPKRPATTSTLDAGEFCEAFVAASCCTDADNPKYALGGVCLRGATLQVVASDGLQAFLQGSFNFGWDTDIVCPPAKIFAAKELPTDGEMLVGIVGNYVYFQFGDVEFWLTKLEGHFPKLDSIVQPTANQTIEKRSDYNGMARRH